jgi:FdhE protein
LLDDFWDARENMEDPSVNAREFFARAFLQPYAEFVRLRADMKWDGYTGSICPFCGRKPGLGALRQQGDGGRRCLLCSFCLAEWDFRRIVCPGCGEEDHRNLPVYTASQFDHVRVECCDRCKQYIKTVDMTKTGLAEPVIDELASVPLDLWAREHGYTKLQRNLLQL